MYCMAVKLDGNGKKMGEPVQLDSTDNINYSANNKIYSVINSDDKQKLMVFKINTKNDRAHVLTTSLFDKDLVLQKKRG
jgi:6-phosphogluconolactonase (cycloisomerase 2 family)